MDLVSRDFRLDVFRIFCMYLICLNHSVWYVASRWTHPLVCLSSAGVIGFVLISGYFGIRFSWRKVVNLELTALSCAFLVILLGENTKFEVFSILALKQLVTVWKWYWFVHAYVFLMCLAPLVPDVRTYKDLNVRTFIPIILAVYGWSFLTLVPGVQAYVPRTPGLTAYSGITLFAVYLIGRLFRAYDGARLNACLVYLVALIGGVISVLSGPCCLRWGGVLSHYNSPFLLAFGFGLFFFFHCWMSPFPLSKKVRFLIKLITPSILSVYLIHCNVYGFRGLGFLERHLLWCPETLRFLLVAFIVFVGCILLDIPRRMVVAILRTVRAAVSGRLNPLRGCERTKETVNSVFL